MGASVATLGIFTFVAMLGAVNLAFGLHDGNGPQVTFGILLMLVGVILDAITAISGRTS
jgi:hypothetical protein